MVRFPLLLVALSAAPAVLAAATEAPLRVTTDSTAYCQELVVRVASQPSPATEVRNLAQEGQRLCETGHVRTGIAKLRRALRATQHGS